MISVKYQINISMLCTAEGNNLIIKLALVCKSTKTEIIYDNPIERKQNFDAWTWASGNMCSSITFSWRKYFFMSWEVTQWFCCRRLNIYSQRSEMEHIFVITINGEKRLNLRKGREIWRRYLNEDANNRPIPPWIRQHEWRHFRFTLSMRQPLENRAINLILCIGVTICAYVYRAMFRCIYVLVYLSICKYLSNICACVSICMYE